MNKNNKITANLAAACREALRAFADEKELQAMRGESVSITIAFAQKSCEEALKAFEQFEKG